MRLVPTPLFAAHFNLAAKSIAIIILCVCCRSIAFFAVVELRASKLLVPVVGGTVCGVLVIIIFLLLVIVLIILVCKKTRPELKCNIDDTLGKPSFNIAATVLCMLDRLYYLCIFKHN